MTETSYISTSFDYDQDKILTWERPVKGGARSLVQHKPPRYFYVPNEEGAYTSITGEKLEKLVFDDKDEFEATKRQYPYKFESDINPEARLLMDMYYGRPVPVINFAFIDIENDYQRSLGWSTVENPYAPINAITIYQSWTNEFITYGIPPKGWKKTDAEFKAELISVCEKHKIDFVPNVFVVKNEKELLQNFLLDIEDADIISGWNSEFFDNPYIIKRLQRVLGKAGAAKMCFPGTKPPIERLVKKFGEDSTTFILNGRTHLDYMDLFKKFTFEGRVSYSLGNIAAEELDVPKIEYDGTLEELYNRDFVEFLVYNLRDVDIIKKLDDKFKFMNLINQMAHENTVPFGAILGTVRYVETGVMNRAHNVHNLIATNKIPVTEENEKVEGAIVMTPLAGYHKWGGAVDLKSLYPNTMIALNVSIETFRGQFYEEEKAWRGIIAKDNNIWILKSYEGDLELTGAEWYEQLRQLNWAISAFGTLFCQNKPGMLADTLLYWFNERIRLQAEKKKYQKLADNEQDPIKKLEYEKLTDYYDLLQLTKKISINSAYGATLNENFRWGRREIGASTTGTGRQITTHMVNTIGGMLDGSPVSLEKKYAAIKNGSSWKEIPGESIAKWRRDSNWADMDTLSKTPVRVGAKQEPAAAVYYTKSKSIIYSDTDSAYFSTGADNYEDAVEIADAICDETNKTFPDFMSHSFNCTGFRKDRIEASREIVFESGVFLLAKKKYTLKVVNLDGRDLRAKPKLKSMGSEIKKADTPKVVQDFLKDMMNLILDGKSYSVLEEFVNKSRGSLIRDTKDILSLAPAKAANNLNDFQAEYERTEKVGLKCSRTIPGHIRAAINYNELATQFESTGAALVKSGDKVAILYLKPNDWNIKSIGFPSEMMHLPKWFTEHFDVDMKITEERMIDNKCERVFEALGWDLPTPQVAFLNKMFSF